MPTTQEQLIIDGIAHGSRSFTGPEHVVIDLTNRCNNDCIACWTRSPLLGNNRPEPEWHKQQLKTDVVLSLIDELAALGTSIIRFTGGGEPFLHKDILKLIRAVKQHNIFCAVTTSLNMVSADQADDIVDSGVDELSVSLWASNGAEYVATHPNKSGKTFERITQALYRIAERKTKTASTLLPFRKKIVPPRINLLNVISKVNYKGLEGMYDYALSVQADSVYFTVVDIIEGSTDSLLLSADDRQAVDQTCNIIEKKNKTLFGKEKILLDNFQGFRDRINDQHAKTGQYDEDRVESIPCYIGWLFCRVMADGQVAPCCRGVNIPMGDLHEQSFKEIWFSEKYNRFRKRAKNIREYREYFSQIGCGKTCDNHMHNMEMHQRLARTIHEHSDLRT